MCVYMCICTLAAFRRSFCLSLIQMSKITVSPERNPNFGRSLFLFFYDNFTDLFFWPAQVACYDMLSTAHLNLDVYIFTHILTPNIF